jgi:polysaccharide pyruvyl transferase WcaK-like protein
LSTGCNSKALYICRDKNSYLTLKDIKMKAIIATIVSAFALTAFAAEPAKAPATPAATASAPAPAKAEVKKDEKKPAKSDSAKKDAPKADAKPATPAAK